MKKILLLAVIATILLLGCTQPQQPQQPPQQQNNSFLKDIVVNELDNGTSMVTLVYVFPDAGYNVTVLHCSLDNGTLVIYTRVVHREPAAQVITPLNETVFVNGTGIKMVVVYTLGPKVRANFTDRGVCYV